MSGRWLILWREKAHLLSRGMLLRVVNDQRDDPARSPAQKLFSQKISCIFRRAVRSACAGGLPSKLGKSPCLCASALLPL